MNSAQRRVSKRTPKPKQRGFPVPVPNIQLSTQTPALQAEPQEETFVQDIAPIGPIETYHQMVEQKQPTEFCPAPDPFEWTTERTLEMLYSMRNLRPVGKYSQIISIM